MDGHEVDLVLSTNELKLFIQFIVTRRNDSAEQSSFNMQEYFDGIQLDNSTGRDQIEEMLRACTPDGEAFLTSVDNNAGE
jgi:hypothetical protein